MMRYELRPKVILLGVFISAFPFILIEVGSVFTYLEYGTNVGEFHISSVFEIIDRGVSVSIGEFVLWRLFFLLIFWQTGLMYTLLVGLSIITFGIISTRRRTAFKILIIMVGVWIVIYFGTSYILYAN